MKALLVVAHGSRRDASNQEVALLVETMWIAHQQSTQHTGFDLIDVAFLELAQPSIGDAIDTCAEKGATQITVLPYFLSAGRHVVEDIPREIRLASARHPSIEIGITGHIGSIPAMPQLLLESAMTSSLSI